MLGHDGQKRGLFRVILKHKYIALMGFLAGLGLAITGSFLLSQIRPLQLDVTSVSNWLGVGRFYNHLSPEKKSIKLGEESDVQTKVSEQFVPPAKAHDSVKKEPANLKVPTATEQLTKRLTVLLVGVDGRPGETSIGNTDTLILASIDPQHRKTVLLSIPRDTQVEIPGYGLDKINAAARLGKGLRTTIDVLEDLLGEPIDGYILTNFPGFKRVIDTLGGITVTVEKNMYYVTGDAEDGVINLKKGTQRLNGAQALQYARFRHDALADISRTTRQQKVIKSVINEMMQPKTIPKLPVLIPQLFKAVKTDLTLGQLWSLATLMTNRDQIEIITQTLPGNFAMEKGISYWKINPEQVKLTVRRLFVEGKTSSVFFGSLSNP